MSIHASGRFEIVRVLGEGSGGIVYLAADRNGGDRVAVKTLRSTSSDAIAVLKNEFRIVQDLHHPNLVEIRELVQEGDTWLLTMEHVAGVDFTRHVRGDGGSSSERRRGFDEARLRSSLRQLASAVVALHRAGLVHRDIKPANVLVASTGRVVVLDFGIARDARARGARADEGMAGTVPYMAPEQITGDDVGPAADWYAVGTMLYAALTGQLPFDGAAHEIMEAKVSRAAPDPKTLVPDLPGDLSTLCRALLDEDPNGRPSGDDVLARLGVDEQAGSVARDAPCVGRDEDFAVLRAAYDDVSRHARGVTVIVEGESGVGKSCFVREFARQLVATATATAAPPLVLLGRCYEREDVPFKAFSSVVEALVEHLRELPDSAVDALLPEGAALLPRVFSDLGRLDAVLARADAPSPDPKETRRRTFAAFRALIWNVAATSGLVVLIDDLQWADGDSFQLLAELVRPPLPPAVLLVCTMRVGSEGGNARNPALGVLPGDVRRIALERLGPESSLRLVGDLCAQLGTRVAPESARALALEAGGHPMFLAELVRRRASTHASDEHALGLDDALLARIALLPSPARRLLEAVCLAGVPFPQQIARHAASLDAGEVSSAVSLLRAEHFVVTGGGGRPDAIEPYHDRIREAVVGAFSASDLLQRHGRIAVALEQAATADPEMLARHWLGAGNERRAAEFSLLAADRASAGLAFDRAARLYESAMRPNSAGADPAQLRAIRMKLAEALTNAGQWAAAAEHRLVLADEHDGLTALGFRRLAAEQLLCSGDFDRGAALLDDCSRSLGIFVPRSPLVILLSVLVTRLLLRLRGLAYVARDARDVAPVDIARLEVLSTAGSGLAMNDHVISNYFITRATLLALRVGEPNRLTRALAFTAGTHASLGHAGRAGRTGTDELLAATRGVANTVRTPMSDAMLAQADAWSAYLCGDWTAAKPFMLHAQALYRDQCFGVPFFLNGVRALLFRTLMYRGDVAELDEHLSPALREADMVGDVFAATNMRTAPLVWLRLVGDRADLAESDLAWVAARLPKSRFLLQHFFYTNAAVMRHLYEGDAAAAFEEIERTWRPLRRSLLLRIATVRALATEQRGRVALAVAVVNAGERRRMLARVAAAALSLEREKMAFSDGHAALLRAGMAALAGDRASATRAAERAQAAFERAEMSVATASAQYWRGELLGGDEGAKLVADATARLSAKGVKAPAKLVRMLAPCHPLLERS